MSDQRRQRRGRPKGSGINDWNKLFAIAKIMESDRHIRVTTAIKMLGFTDPSTIRRLRDKFKSNRHALIRPLDAQDSSSLSPSSVNPTTKEGHNSLTNHISNQKLTERKHTEREALKRRHLTRANDALAEYAHLADRPISVVSGFQASIAHRLLQQTQDYGMER